MPVAVMCSSFPKAGRGLLIQMLAGVLQRVGGNDTLASFNHFGWGDRRWPFDTIINTMRDNSRASFMVGHIACDEPIRVETQIQKVPVIFLYRDLRDVVVSTTYHIESERGTLHFPDKHHFWRMKSHEERMRQVILGSGVLPSLWWRWEQYAGWLETPDVLCLSYREMRWDPKRCAIRIAAHVGLPEQVAPLMVDAINPVKSVTFRAGKVGDWQSEFTPELKDLFKWRMGDWLVRLGFEEGDDW